MVRDMVTDFILVTEEEIRDAIRYSWDVYHERIEGSAAVTLAALLTGKVTSRPAVAIITGGNINPIEFEQIIKGDTISTLQKD
jgi:threonine dehydratase